MDTTGPNKSITRTDSLPEPAPRICTVTFQDKPERAEEMDFETQKEGWSEYRLPDGTIIKLKNVVSRILRLTARTRENGSPFYVVEGSALLTTIPPSDIGIDEV